MRKTKISAQEKLHTVKNILHGIESIHAAAKRLSVDPSAVRVWICSYKGNGIDAFTHIKNNYYSHECKVQAVTAYLNQEGSLSAICQRFGLRSPTQLRRWIKRYNSHEELKASGTGGKRKPEDQLTEVERLRAELKLERAKRKQAEMEISFLKKLDEIERRRD
ncbi:MAG: transposase [Megasphaera sp.]|nr:transposase [Megasphaera sp.]